MLESILIKNFRNFRSLKIDSLSRVNLVVGKNNAGKSNLLDAISIYASSADLNWIAQILERRELLQKNFGKVHDFILTGDGEDVFSSLFPNWNKSDSSNNQIVIEAIERKCTKKHVVLRLVRMVDQTSTSKKFGIKILQENEHSEFSIIRGFQTFSPIHNHKMMIFDGAEHFFMPSEIQYFIPFRYISTRVQKIAESDDLKLWGDISISPLKSIVLDVLKIVDQRIVDFNYIACKGIKNFFVPHIRLKDSDSSTPLHSLGDGVKRVLTIILNLISAKEGLLLIDEFENGLHYTIQNPLWRMIFNVAEKLDVQVFASTHSEDCLRAFSNVLKDSTCSDFGQVVSLAKVKDDIECAIYKAKHLEEAIKYEMEVR